MSDVKDKTLGEAAARKEKLNFLQTSGKNPFLINRYEKNANCCQIVENYEQFQGKEVSLSGRIMSKRVMGNICFADIKDFSGTLQCYVKKDCMEVENFKEFKKFDVGDIVGVIGEICKTQRHRFTL